MEVQATKAGGRVNGWWGSGQQMTTGILATRLRFLSVRRFANRLHRSDQTDQLREYFRDVRSVHPRSVAVDRRLLEIHDSDGRPGTCGESGKRRRRFDDERGTDCEKDVALAGQGPGSLEYGLRKLLSEQDDVGPVKPAAVTPWWHVPTIDAVEDRSSWGSGATVDAHDAVGVAV